MSDLPKDVAEEVQQTLSEMLDAVAPKRWEEGDWTIAMVAEKHDVNKNRARRILENLLEQGAVEKFWGVGPDGQSCNIYRKK
jgi:predicted ArsR family transcriptional regulator